MKKILVLVLLFLFSYSISYSQDDGKTKIVNPTAEYEQIFLRETILDSSGGRGKTPSDTMFCDIDWSKQVSGYVEYSFLFDSAHSKLSDTSGAFMGGKLPQIRITWGYYEPGFARNDNRLKYHADSTGAAFTLEDSVKGINIIRRWLMQVDRSDGYYFVAKFNDADNTLASSRRNAYIRQRLIFY